MDFYNQELVRHMQHLQQVLQQQQQQVQQQLPAVSSAGPASAAGQPERPPALPGRPESPAEAADDKSGSAFSQVRPPSAETHKGTLNADQRNGILSGEALVITHTYFATKITLSHFEQMISVYLSMI